MPSGKTGYYITFVAIGFGIIALLFLIALTIIGIRIVCRSERQPQSQENPEELSENGIQNRNSYFSIGSSSSENFEEENIEERTPIIRPKFRSNVQQ